MFEWFPLRATAAEVTVAHAILRGARDRRAELLLEQFRTSRRVERHIEGPTLRVVVPWTTEDLMVDLDEDVTSEPVRVHDVLSGQPLRFRVDLARGGFFRRLEGRGDTRWPRRWDVDPDELATAASGALRLPDEPSSDALTAWLGIAVPERAGLVLSQPATPASIEALQRQGTLALPAEVRGFLEATDGLVVAGWAILGVRDLHVVEFEGGWCWQIAVRVDPDDDRRCLLAPDGAFVIVPAHDAHADDFELIETGLRKWIAGLVDGTAPRSN